MSDDAVIILAAVALFIYFDAKQTKVQATQDAARQIGEGAVDGLEQMLQRATGGGAAPGMAGDPTAVVNPYQVANGYPGSGG